MTLPDLKAIVEGAAVEELPAVLGALVEAEERARLRLRTPLAPQREEQLQARQVDRLLTVADAAEVMRCRENYVETLVREGKIPTVRLPGTSKGGQAREGRQRRILLSSLLAHLKAGESKGGR